MFVFLFIDISPAIKRIKRTSSPTNVLINGINDHSEDDDEDDEESEEDDERDSTAMSPKTFLTCPVCNSTYHRLGHLLRHAKRKHHMDLSNYDGPHTFDMLTAQIRPMETTEIENNRDSIESLDLIKTEDINGSKRSAQSSSKFSPNYANNTWSNFSLQMNPIYLQQDLKPPIVLIVIIKRRILNNLKYILSPTYVIKIIDVYCAIVCINTEVRSIRRNHVIDSLFPIANR